MTLLQVELAQDALSSQNTLKAQNLLNCECQFTRVTTPKLLVEESAENTQESGSQTVNQEELKSLLAAQLKEEIKHEEEVKQKQTQAQTQ